MTLYEEIKELWTPAVDAKSAGWVAAALKAIDDVNRAGGKFRRPPPLRFYVTLTKLASAKRTVVFSVRFSGQEVAEIHVKPEAKRELVISPKHEKTNKRDFGLVTLAGPHPWGDSGGVAQQFRKDFLNLDGSGGTNKRRGTEHSIEARMLEAMERRTGRITFGTLADIRHVGVTSSRKFLFQCPVPFSAHDGKAGKRAGHIDILARHGRGKPRLAVWELKAPHTEAPLVVRQAYIYSVGLALMLRGSRGADWWRFFGFGSTLPKKLKIETVVAVTADQGKSVREQAQQLLASDHHALDLKAENAVLTLHAAYYDEKTMKIDYCPLP